MNVLIIVVWVGLSLISAIVAILCCSLGAWLFGDNIPEDDTSRLQFDKDLVLYSAHSRQWLEADNKPHWYTRFSIKIRLVVTVIFQLVFGAALFIGSACGGLWVLFWGIPHFFRPLLR
jgi:hypothetical protein